MTFAVFLILGLAAAAAAVLVALLVRAGPYNLAVFLGALRWKGAECANFIRGAISRKRGYSEGAGTFASDSEDGSFQARVAWEDGWHAADAVLTHPARNAADNRDGDDTK